MEKNMHRTVQSQIRHQIRHHHNKKVNNFLSHCIHLYWQILPYRFPSPRCLLSNHTHIYAPFLSISTFCCSVDERLTISFVFVLCLCLATYSEYEFALFLFHFILRIENEQNSGMVLTNWLVDVFFSLYFFIDTSHLTFTQMYNLLQIFICKYTIYYMQANANEAVNIRI